MPTAGWAFGEPDVQLNNYTEGGDAVIQGLLGDNEPDPGAPFGNHNPADDIPGLTNSSDASPAAQTYEERVSVRLCTGTDLQVCGEPVGVGHG